ncbi:MAG: ABC transporter permease, partial [Spirochaetes bacterium]|nr:ABC transporter permease [Spirochaetota bacterium]
FSIGIMVGGVAPDIKTASVLASILYFLMLVFSGTTLPYEVMPEKLQRLADILPLTHGIKLLKATSLGLPIDSVFIPTIVIVAFAVICTGVSIRFFRWE